MPTVVIQVAGTEAPQYGKKRGRIKDTAGTLYQAAPNFLDMVRPGQSYELTYKDDEFNGAKFRVVEGIVPSVARAPEQPAARQAAPPARYDQPFSADPLKDERISVLALMKSHQLPVGDRVAILHALKAAALAWRDFKRWQVDSNIESGRQPLQGGYEDGDPGP